MRPWLLVAGDFTRLGGMDRANHALATFLARHGADVHLVTHRVAEDLGRYPNVKIHTVSRPARVHLIGFPLLSARARHVARALERPRIVANGGNVAFSAPVWVHYLHAAFRPIPARSLRSRLTSGPSAAYFRHQERRAISRAPIVICNSRRTAQDVQQHFSLDVSRLPVVYYGSDAQFAVAAPSERAASRTALGIVDERPVALFVGALGDRRKGFDVLFEAWRRLCADAAWQADLLVAGAGEGRDAWPGQARAAGLQSRVRFLGFRSDIAGVLAAADLVVHPARYEAYGLAVHEAICRGIPVIVTRCAGVAERIPVPLANLLLPATPSVESLEGALRRWYRTRTEWHTRAVAAAPAFAARTWDDMSSDIVNLLEGA
jgi:glycosyltransferase involved in cell wall biosynthesis